MISSEEITKLNKIAIKLRKHVIEMLCIAGSGHPGGSLSAADIVTVLYFYLMKHDPQQPKDKNRDRFVMSKGHAAPILYSALAESGYFPTSELKTLRQIGSKLQGHIDMKSLPGIEMSTGSLGQGLSAANGMALAGRLDKADYRVYCLLGDGECQEGQVWEAALSAAHYRLDNLTAIIDHNKYQIDGAVKDVKNLHSLAEKFKAFNWNVLVCNGHDIKALIEAFAAAKACKGKPSIIVADTIKGKGIPFMESNPCEFHGKTPTKEQEQLALKCLCEEENKW